MSQFKKPSKGHVPQIDMAQWVQEVCMPLTQRRVYIAIIPNEDGGWHYDLEIETIPRDTVGAVWATNTFNVEKARAEADKLARELGRRGFYVVHTRAEWERDLDDVA